MAKLDEVTEGMLDTSKVKAFRAPAGVPVEIYATTLHYVPCHTDPETGFRSAVVLPAGTNMDKPVFTPKTNEDRWMAGCNKWLLAHPDTREAKEGAYIGLRGENIDIGGDDYGNIKS